MTTDLASQSECHGLFVEVVTETLVRVRECRGLEARTVLDKSEAGDSEARAIGREPAPRMALHGEPAQRRACVHGPRLSGLGATLHVILALPAPRSSASPAGGWPVAVDM